MNSYRDFYPYTRIFYWWSKVYGFNPVVYDYLQASSKPKARWTSIRLGMVYNVITFYRLFGVFMDPPELGGGYMQNSVSFTVFIMVLSGHLVGYYQMKERLAYAALYNTMMSYEVSTSGGKQAVLILLIFSTTLRR
jgi:hypothetical protein